ncbi:MAG: hypothetical protein Harvfovirus3_72 [Harvfovirus sp.]|uniref:FNIP repeat-containing protein n=1 Tax=Harvfovirus sp. TaxID=2487768 RepID=A0A3G5A0B5_9VIRU|nr:MAG: hypothetical protein Harvfovirus3_72 [Harvfovirus sp.]
MTSTEFKKSNIPTALVNIMRSHMKVKDYHNFAQVCKLFRLASYKHIVEEFMSVAIKVPSHVIIKKVKIYNKAEIALIDKNVTHILFDDNFNETLPKFPIGNSVKHITFGKEFNQPFTPKHITFQYNLNLSIDCIFGLGGHSSVTDFAYDSDQLLPNMPSITHLILGSNFNQPLTGMPSSVTHLTVGQKFDQELTAISPSVTIHKPHTKEVPESTLP